MKETGGGPEDDDIQVLEREPQPNPSKAVITTGEAEQTQAGALVASPSEQDMVNGCVRKCRLPDLREGCPQGGSVEVEDDSRARGDGALPPVVSGNNYSYEFSFKCYT